MAEIQRMPQSGEMPQRFIRFIMLQSQQAGLFLGLVPHPQTGETEVNLEAARHFMDNLEMIREKTTGNLSATESDILDKVIDDLDAAFSRNLLEGLTPGEPPADE